VTRIGFLKSVHAALLEVAFDTLIPWLVFLISDAPGRLDGSKDLRIVSGMREDSIS